jgi:hypothetical protein
MITAENLTDEQIREEWRAGHIDCFTRDLAIRTYRGGGGETWRAETRIAAAINARRAKGDSNV